MSNFSRVHVRGSGVCENKKKKSYTLNFLDDFFFSWDFWHSKMLMCTLFWGGEGVSESVWFIHS